MKQFLLKIVCLSLILIFTVPALAQQKVKNPYSSRTEPTGKCCCMNSVSLDFEADKIDLLKKLHN